MNKTIKKVNLKNISEAVNDSYHNSVLETINNHCLRMSVMEGEYKWHYHENSDELFIILEGELKIEIKDHDTLYVKPGEYVKIPAKTIHKTSAIGRSVNLCFERDMEDTIFIE